jgi:hypothetical protein
MPCRVVRRYQRFGGAWCIHRPGQAFQLEALPSTECQLLITSRHRKFPCHQLYCENLRCQSYRFRTKIAYSSVTGAPFSLVSNITFYVLSLACYSDKLATMKMIIFVTGSPL